MTIAVRIVAADKSFSVVISGSPEVTTVIHSRPIPVPIQRGKGPNPKKFHYQSRFFDPAGDA
jgi:hypothetical protein